MNAQHEIERLLEQSGAVLVRQNKHLVYRLPNGKNFVAAKTSSDPDRAAQNSLSDLRRALGIVRPAPKPEGDEPTMPTEQPLPQQPQPFAPDREALKQRIETAIAEEEAAQEKLLAQAQNHERKIHMLRVLLPFAEDPAAEDSLRDILPATRPPAQQPAQSAAPEPPEAITERVQVTRQLVLAATQTFEDLFTVNDVLELMAGGSQIDGKERVRIRQSIAQAMVTLHERGELIRVSEGSGRRPSTWRKASLGDVGTRA